MISVSLPALAGNASTNLVKSLLIGASAVAMLSAAPAVAQGSATSSEQRQVRFDIPAQSLEGTVTAFGLQSGMRVSAEQLVLAGLQSPGVIGDLAPMEALSRLLTGTGVTWRQIDARSIALVKAPQAADDSAIQLGPVRVEGRMGRDGTSSISGIPGTELTGSYGTSKVSVGKGLDVRELPQSVSVVTRQRMDDQGIISLTGALEQVTGISLNYHGMSGSVTGIFSRGFEINNQQIDGVTVGNFAEYYNSISMAMYDSVEVLRGADGLYGGTGEPGGSVNLVRKRPLADARVSASLAAGSWKQKRAEMDATGPIALDGRLRARLVVAHEDREFFFDTADSRKTLLYGVIEADIGSNSMLTIGGSYEKGNEHPWYFGTPRYNNGDEIGFPRSRSLMTNWSVMNQKNKDFFIKYDQGLPFDWKLKASVNYNRSVGFYNTGNAYGAVDLSTGSGAYFSGGVGDLKRIRKAFDINVSGPFQLIGREHNLLLGFDRQDEDRSGANYRRDTPIGWNPYLDILSFYPDSIPNFTIASRSSKQSRETKQEGVYGRLSLNLANRLTAIVGGRYSSFKSQWPRTYFNTSGVVTSTQDLTYSESGIFTNYFGIMYRFNDRWTAYASSSDIRKSQANRLEGPAPGTPMSALTGRSYEVGVKGTLLNGNLNTSLSIYRINRKGEAFSDENYPPIAGELGRDCCYLKKGSVTSEGVEAEMSGELARDWQIFAGYTYSKNHDKVDDEAYNTRSPKHILRVWSTYRLPGNLSTWTMGAGINYQSRMYNWGTVKSYNPVTGIFNGPSSWYQFSQRSYAVFNASVEHKFSNNFSAKINLNNIFDKVYYKYLSSANGNNWYGDPRNILITVRADF